MEDKLLAILTGCLAFEVDDDRSFPVNLLEGLCRIVPDRDDKTEQIGAVFGQFRKGLDKVECPLAPFLTFSARFVMEPVVPGLKFVQD